MKIRYVGPLTEGVRIGPQFFPHGEPVEVTGTLAKELTARPDFAPAKPPTPQPAPEPTEEDS